jgi:hypothetical protein
LVIFRISVKKIQVSLKSDNNSGYFTSTPIYIFVIYLSLLIMVDVSDKVGGENQNTLFIFNTLFRNHAAYEICGEILYNQTSHR